jgi:hypothetical protein
VPKYLIIPFIYNHRHSRLKPLLRFLITMTEVQGALKWVTLIRLSLMSNTTTRCLTNKYEKAQQVSPLGFYIYIFSTYCYLIML